MAGDVVLPCCDRLRRLASLPLRCILAEKIGLSASWIGLILLATATSLPELVTGLSAVTVADTPDIAVGDVLGSTMFNLAILIVLDALYRRETIYSRAAQGHILSAALGILLIAFAGFSLLLDRAGSTPALGHVGHYTPFIILVYIIAMRAIYQYEQLHWPSTLKPRRIPGCKHSTGNSRLRDCGSRVRGRELMTTFRCQG